MQDVSVGIQSFVYMVKYWGGSLFVLSLFYGHRSLKFIPNSSRLKKGQMFGMKSPEDRNEKYRMFGMKVVQKFVTKKFTMFGT
jgi:hypothetical protein